jgi:endonuclease III
VDELAILMLVFQKNYLFVETRLFVETIFCLYMVASMLLYLKKMKKENLKQIFKPIIQEYGGKKIELDYETPFQLLCAVILSAQTTDKQVNRISKAFFERVKEASDVTTLSLESIEKDLKYVNFFRNKSRFIKETGTIIANKYQGIIPNDLALLQTFPGIGIKTAKVVLSVLYDMPYV